MNRFVKLGSAALLAGLVAAPAAAIDYKERQITIVIGYGFGGTYGKYARSFADNLRNQIPGRPNIIVQSMPGAGGIKMTNYAYNVMPRDGYWAFIPPDTTVVSQLLRPTKVKYKANEFSYLGASNQTNTILVVRKDTGINSIMDVKTKKLVTGNTGPGSTSYLIPQMVKHMLGLDAMQIISGYKGSRKTILAVEQGEITGAAFNWLAWASIAPHWFEKGKEFAAPILQTGAWKDPDLPNVPMLAPLVKDEHKPIVSFMATLGIIGRGLALPPSAPKEATTVLRKAFTAMVKDPAYLAEAKKRRLRVLYTSGEDIQAFVEKSMKDANPEVVAAAQKIIFPKK